MLNIRILTNALRELERTRETEFPPDGESDRPAPRAAVRELDHRRSDGIDVRLLWSQTDDQVLLAVSDAKRGERFAIAVEPHEARAAFQHPYAYAASKGGPQHTLAV
jgi:hypothetical protein